MTVTTDKDLIKGSAILEALTKADVQTVVALPDIVTCESVLWPISKDSRFHLVMVCKEDEGVSICAGLSYCNHRSILLIQHTGFLDSINAIRAIAVEYQLPIVMLVGLQGMESDRSIKSSSSLGIRALAPICDGLELDYKEISNSEDTAQIASLIQASYSRSQPIALFFTSSPV